MGDFVAQDEPVANIETDKVTIPVNAPAAGRITAHLAEAGETVQVGSNLFKYDPDQLPSKTSPSTASTPSTPSKPGKEIKVEEPLRPPSQSQVLEKAEKETKTSPPARSRFVGDQTVAQGSPPSEGNRNVTREALTRMRQRIAERMKQSQNTAAALTTFNEVDMSALMAMRQRHKEEFSTKHGGIKFGFMSPFIKAAATVLQEIPIVNARFDGEAGEIVYHQYVDISVAVATPKGLVTPVIRNCEHLSLLDLERTMQGLSERARGNRMALEELTGGTFTISNGGVFGSLMGTPIINSPQSAILGMHAIRDRAVVVEGRVEVRPMMYVALTYDHRLIDGREAVTFLVRLKQLLEDPQRMLLDL